jgi:hypothetical protein
VATRQVSLTDEDIQCIRASLLGNGSLKWDSNKKVLDKLSRSQQRITVSSAKEKGRNLQYWVCTRISELLGIPYVQQDDSCLIHSREMGQRGTDIALRGEARDRFPFDIEAKATKQFRIVDAVKQAEANTAAGRYGMVVHRPTGQQPVVVFSWDTFARMYQDVFIGVT